MNVRVQVSQAFNLTSGLVSGEVLRVEALLILKNLVLSNEARVGLVLSAEHFEYLFELVLLRNDVDV